MPEIIGSYLEESDQWFDHGWRYENGEVYSFTNDRKEQNTQEGHHYTVEEFFADQSIDIKVKRWLKDLLGDECDIVIEEDIPYKN